MCLAQESIKWLLDEAEQDEVGLWMICSVVRDTLRLTDDEKVRDATLDAVKRLLDTGQVVVGGYRDGYGSPVAPWNINNNAALSRIESMWNDLEREPQIGDEIVFIGKRLIG